MGTDKLPNEGENGRENLLFLATGDPDFIHLIVPLLFELLEVWNKVKHATNSQNFDNDWL